MCSCEHCMPARKVFIFIDGPMFIYLMDVWAYQTYNPNARWRLNVLCFNRFHYAARIWDAVKKSSALSEYSRLLCWSFAWSAVAQRSASSWQKETTALQMDVVVRTQRAPQEEVDTTWPHLKLELLQGLQDAPQHLTTHWQEVARQARCRENSAAVVVMAVLNENTFLS